MNLLNLYGSVAQPVETKIKDTNTGTDLFAGFSQAPKTEDQSKPVDLFAGFSGFQATPTEAPAQTQSTDLFASFNQPTTTPSNDLFAGFGGAETAPVQT